jgi:hypothetical protein
VILLDLTDEAFDQMSLTIRVPVIFAIRGDEYLVRVIDRGGEMLGRPSGE